MTEKHTSGDFSKKLVVFIVAFVIAFTAVNLYVFVKVGSEPSTLITAVMAFFGGELWALATIKKKKIHNRGEGES